MMKMKPKKSTKRETNSRMSKNLPIKVSFFPYSYKENEINVKSDYDAYQKSKCVVHSFFFLNCVYAFFL